MTQAKPLPVNTEITFTNRIQSIDLLRGLVMIIMTLDHSRDFFHYGASMDQDPLDFDTTSPVLFLSRWITHFCAPVFVFLSGASVYLYSSKGKTKRQVAFFLFSRGLWLMLVEIFIILPLWNFNFSMVFLQVIWAIGLSMVVLSVLQFLPYRLLVVIGLLIVGGHNLLDRVSVGGPVWASMIWSVTHKTASFPVGHDFMITVQYPFLPWLGIMILGYALGKIYLPSTDPASRKKLLLSMGFAAVALFVLLRWSNVYGDMHHWSAQKTTLFTCLDFIKTTKYPPSLLYTLMTLGPALIFLAFAENISGSLKNKILVFGKVPFFYYILHVLLLHTLSWMLFFATGHHWSDLDFTHFRDGSMPVGSGYPLWVVYLGWITVIVILYFPCRWYSNYKKSHRQWWLSYL
ncbi:MAG TPA: heparan-alpha-glucosaminide N-acetyltransferase domain-containing protein [Puia sp.]|nr:heparan-alpha-glucosaminide N-acetyltransferase domain-containing protein [Puia sp.]